MIVGFVAASTRDGADGHLLESPDALREAEEILVLFPIPCPDEPVLPTALGGSAAYGLWSFNAHLWAYAEAHGLAEIVAEGFEHGRLYAGVVVRNPFIASVDSSCAETASDDGP